MSKLSQALQNKVAALEPEVEYRWLGIFTVHEANYGRPQWRCDGCRVEFPPDRTFSIVHDWDSHYGRAKRSRLCPYCGDLHRRYKR